jgi:hypothetical protein
MMSDKPAFQVDLSQLRTRRKDVSAAAIERTDAAAEQHGFVNRQPGRRRGRLPSPRTGQVHAKVMPPVADEIAAEAQRRGVTQGVIVEEAWLLFKKHNHLP